MASTCVWRLLLGLLPLLAAGEAPLGRRLATTCDAGRKSLLWKVTKGDWTAYLVGTHHFPWYYACEGNELPPEVQQALTCADVAYFKMACPMSSYGHYFNHCHEYPISNAGEDSISYRLDATVLASLKAGIEKVKAKAGSCKAYEAELAEVLDKLPNKDYSRTLRSVYYMALRALNEWACELLEPPAGDPAPMTYEDKLRAAFGVERPIFGLEDVDVKCEAYHRGGVPADVELAQKMSFEFGDDDWIASLRKMQGEDMMNVMACGDLAKMPASPPWEDAAWLRAENARLLASIKNSAAAYPGKTVLVAVGVEHIVNVTGTTGLEPLLAGAGYQVERVDSSANLNCAASTYKAPGAKEQDRCLADPVRVQSKTCDDFKQKWSSSGVDASAKLVKDEAPCKKMEALASHSSSCTMGWTGLDAFRGKCAEEGGLVMGESLTRNPLSVRTGRTQREETVKHQQVLCLHKTCDLSMMSDTALRKWYEKDQTLNLGQVVYSQLDEPESGMLPMGSWACIALAASVLGSLLVCLFMMPKRERKGRGVAQLERDSDSDEPLAASFQDDYQYGFEERNLHPPPPPAPPAPPSPTRGPVYTVVSPPQSPGPQPVVSQRIVMRPPTTTTVAMPPQAWQTVQRQPLLSNMSEGGGILAMANQMQAGLVASGAQAIQSLQQEGGSPTTVSYGPPGTLTAIGPQYQAASSTSVGMPPVAQYQYQNR
mmetsp:Transcript_30456/g.90398  ORF Transcript_30456/g.90398 Transcript_30456/m.90398 type:complete len:712 (+) Transcript_30456:78-2213(+)